MVIDGKVAVRVYVTLADEQVPYAPIGGHGLIAFAGPDTVELTTDDAGAATALLAEGDYALASREPVRWRDRWYQWTVPLAVRPRMAPVELTERNAAPAAPAAGPVPDSPAPPAVPREPTSVDAPVGVTWSAALTWSRTGRRPARVIDPLARAIAFEPERLTERRARARAVCGTRGGRRLVAGAVAATLVVRGDGAGSTVHATTRFVTGGRRPAECTSTGAWERQAEAAIKAAAEAATVGRRRDGR